MAVTAGSRTIIGKPNWNGSASTAFGVEALEVPGEELVGFSLLESVGTPGLPHPHKGSFRDGLDDLRSTKSKTVYGNDPAKAMEHLRHYMISATGRI